MKKLTDIQIERIFWVVFFSLIIVFCFCFGYKAAGSEKYKFPLVEPIYIGHKIIQTGWCSYRRSDMNGKKYMALNYPAREGSVVIACADGQVVAAGQMSGDRYAGWKITILQTDGVTVEYCHVSGQWVLPPRQTASGFTLPGSQVKRGDPIGTVGRTGRTTGSHLRLVFYRNGEKMFANAETFGKDKDDFYYRVGSDNDLKFDII
jgi:murein DD-endopeptidase MepM/ murein hydrolase activator NlpD